MKPILIFRHIECEGPGYLGQYLQEQNLPFQVICVDQGDAIPDSVDGCAGLVFMGGPMSANDSLPWIGKELELIQQAHTENLPVLGHCLGGQLIAKALGGEVISNRVKEIGWHPVEKIANPVADEWLGKNFLSAPVFHWHGETFSIPEHGVPVLSSQFCTNQAFVCGNTLAMQCHVEITHEQVPEWAELYADEIKNPSLSVQTKDEMVSVREQRIPVMQEMAKHLYSRWIQGLDSSSQ